MASGIRVPKEVVTLFNQLRSENQVRWLKLELNGEKLEVGTMKMKTESFQEDFDSIQTYIEDKKCAYFLFRLDETNQFGDQWILIWYVPDTAKAKEKMIYSSTVASLKKDFGESIIKLDMHASTVPELSYKEYEAHGKKSEGSQKEVQMSFAEILKKEEKDESATYSSISTSGLKGVGFPISDDALENLRQVAGKTLDLCVLKLADEKFEVDSQMQQCDKDSVGDQLSKTEPRFTFWNYNHTWNDEQQTVCYFIYSCPTESKVKERMKYSSSKATILQYAKECGIILGNTSIEVSDVKDVTGDFLHEYIHPKVQEEKTFKKPMKPGRSKK